MTVTLKALQTAVFHDDKDGYAGDSRGALPGVCDGEAEVLRDANGNATPVSARRYCRVLPGVYRTSEGKVGDAAWGDAGEVVRAGGHDTAMGSRAETIAVFDHPGNPNYPTYWHARGYGLFAVNPLGAHIFDPQGAADELHAGEGATSATFRYRVLLVWGPVNSSDMNKEADEFATEYVSK